MTDDLMARIGAKEIEQWAEFFSLMIYAESGIGKTHFIGTAADHPLTSPVLLLDLEGGRQTLVGKTGVHYVRVKTRSKLIAVQNELFKAGDDMPYRTVALDSTTETQDIDMREIMKVVKKEDSKRDEEVPSPREWGMGRWHMRDIIRSFRDLPCHTIFTALEIDDREEGKQPKYYPNLPGKLRGEIPGFVDIVARYRKEMVKGNQVWKMQLEGTHRVLAKTRFSVLGASLENPTMPMIRDLIPSQPPTEESEGK